MIYFDTGDLAGRTFLMEEDDDGIRCRARIIEVLDDHEKNVADNPVLKKFKCLIFKTNLRRFFLTTKSCNILRRLMMMRRPSGNTNGSPDMKAL
jgi:catabolite regulation protein CreA